MKKFLAMAALGCAVLLTGCAVPKGSGIVSSLQIDQITPDTAFIDNAVQPLKKGEATATGILCFTEGDGSITAAMKNGGIKKIHHVDFKTKTIFFVYTQRTTIVWGE